MPVDLTPTSFPIGDISLIEREHKTAFLSSRNMSDACRPAIKAWLGTLKPDVDCVMIGNIQKIEKEILDALVGLNIPTVLVLDRPFPEMWPLNLVQAIGDQRLLVVTTSDFLLPWVDKFGMADARNRYMIANSETVVLGFCRPGGQLDGQLKGINVNVKVLNPYSPQLERVVQNGYNAFQQNKYKVSNAPQMAAEPQETYGGGQTKSN